MATKKRREPSLSDEDYYATRFYMELAKHVPGLKRDEVGFGTEAVRNSNGDLHFTQCRGYLVIGADRGYAVGTNCSGGAAKIIERLVYNMLAKLRP